MSAFTCSFQKPAISNADTTATDKPKNINLRLHSLSLSKDQESEEPPKDTESCLIRSLRGSWGQLPSEVTVLSKTELDREHTIILCLADPELASSCLREQIAAIHQKLGKCVIPGYIPATESIFARCERGLMHAASSLFCLRTMISHEASVPSFELDALTRVKEHPRLAVTSVTRSNTEVSQRRTHNLSRSSLLASYAGLGWAGITAATAFFVGVTNSSAPILVVETLGHWASTAVAFASFATLFKYLGRDQSTSEIPGRVWHDVTRSMAFVTLNLGLLPGAAFLPSVGVACASWALSKFALACDDNEESNSRIRDAAIETVKVIKSQFDQVSASTKALCLVNKDQNQAVINILKSQGWQESPRMIGPTMV